MENEKRAIEIRKEKPYEEMNQEELILVSEYETNLLKDKVAKMITVLSLEEVKEQIHDWYLNFEIAEETEHYLFSFAENLFRELNIFDKVFEVM